MAGAKEKAAIQEVTIEEIELEVSEIKELDQLAEETRKCGISWEDLKAELGLLAFIIDGILPAPPKLRASEPLDRNRDRAGLRPPWRAGVPAISTR